MFYIIVKLAYILYLIEIFVNFKDNPITLFDDEENTVPISFAEFSLFRSKKR